MRNEQPFLMQHNATLTNSRFLDASLSFPVFSFLCPRVCSPPFVPRRSRINNRPDLYKTIQNNIVRNLSRFLEISSFVFDHLLHVDSTLFPLAPFAIAVSFASIESAHTLNYSLAQWINTCFFSSKVQGWNPYSSSDYEFLFDFPFCMIDNIVHV